MTLTPTKTPLVVKKLFPNYIWDIPTTEKVIYLTFDDGPTPEITNWTLDILKKYNAKATFFCIGNNIEKHPSIFQDTISEGHTIGNHTQNHIKGWKTKAKDYLKNIAEAEAIIKSQIQSSTTIKDKLKKPDSKIQAVSSENQKAKSINPQTLSVNLFRPPYGQIKPKQGKNLIELGYKIIMWDVLSFDWEKEVTKEACLDNVIKKATNGSIIVFHDSVKASKNMQYALPRVLEYFNKKGYSFKSLNSLNESFYY